MGGSFLEDGKFQDDLLRFLVNDRHFLMAVGHMLTEKDFARVDQHGGREREIVAGIALDYWNRYRIPVGQYLGYELEDYKCGPAEKDRTIEYGRMLMKGPKSKVAPDILVNRIQSYKTEKHLISAMNAMQNMITTGNLNVDEFMKIAREAVEKSGKNAERPVDIFSNRELERRIARRFIQQRTQRFPSLLIDPIDREIRIIARKHLGLILAPYGRGKTLFFIWLALAYTMQGLNVLHITLEDPREDIEDRFDAAITSLPMLRLTDMPMRVRERFRQFTRRMKSRLKVYDGTDGQTTVPVIEHVFERERNRGFVADVILVDYDDEIRPVKARQERRFEFAEIYKDYRAMLARHDLIGWTASQTSRASEEMQIISGQMIAEDISKVRKASFAMSLGKGNWGPSSYFLWIAKHRYDKDKLGAHILSDKDRALFFDREPSLKKEQEEKAKELVEA